MDNDNRIAALYVQTNGAYFNLPGVDPWDVKRDARKYAGPHPVVAHPPCARWCRLAGLVEKRWGHKRGEDDGCFAAALSAVNRFGGVLEHPAYSDAWAAFKINRPPRQGGWVRAEAFDRPAGTAWTCHVEQGRYGHMAKKATWLYAVVPERSMLPELRWGSDPDAKSKALRRVVEHQSKRQRNATPAEFRDVLTGIARSIVR